MATDRSICVHMDIIKDTPTSWPRVAVKWVEIQKQRLPTRWRPKLARLRTKLIVPYVLLTMALAMVGTFVVTLLVTSSVRERFVNQLLEASRVGADGLVRQERAHLENLRLMTFTQGVPQALASHDASALRDLLLPLALNNKIEVFSALDVQGREIITLARGPEDNHYLRSEGTDFSGYPLVADILQARPDEVGDKFIALLATAHGPFLFTSAPARDANGQLVGVMMIGTSLNAILTDLKTQALADVFILDSSGKLLATTLPPPDEGYGTLEVAPSGVTGLNTSETHNLRLYRRNFQAVYAPLIVRQQNLGVLGVVLPSNFVTAAGATSRNWFGILFTLGTVAVIAVGYLLAQSIARPILRLRAVSQAVAAGDLEQHTGLKQEDEIGELASAFDRMTLKLRERTAEAARLYNETMQRNRELAVANAKLQAARQQLVQSEKLAAVGHLTAGIVHDVKNPLAIIIGLAEELPEQCQLDDVALKSLRTIRDNGRRASRIVIDLLKFARKATPEVKRQDIRETIETVLRLTEYLARKGVIEVIKDVPPTPVMANYDAAQIEQVFVNLVQNAVQAMPDGGTLRINLSQAQEAVAIAVQDTGIGIPPNNLNRIFDPFFTTKPPGEGTGLGLSVSYGIVARHGGRIDVESTAGNGTTFTVLLPMNPLATPSQHEESLL
jgi:two-component system NtrC family sensor kinase